MDAGVDVRGYIYWSSFDNFEWAHGYGRPSGSSPSTVTIHYRRVVRPSAVAYGTVARSGSPDVLLGWPKLPCRTDGFSNPSNLSHAGNYK
jgi:hypothetical protein